MKTVQQIAAEIAQELREHPERWTQGVFARDEKGIPCFPNDSKAECWCILGFIHKSKPKTPDFWPQLCNLCGIENTGHLSKWNDAPGRTVDDVIALCEKVAS